MKQSIVCISILLLVTALTAQAPQNIIVMIADGCGYEHVRALNYYAWGQDSMLVFQRFPVQLSVQTYPLGGGDWNTGRPLHADDLKRDFTDSAAAGTALSTGCKTWPGYLGLDGWRRPIRHLSELGYEHGKAIGLVTTVVFAHATPASQAVHHYNRSEYPEIARQLLEESPVRVLMGCGSPAYLTADSTNYKPYDFRYTGGEKTWREVLAGKPMADCDNDAQGDPWTTIFQRTTFQSLATGETPKRLLGVPLAGKSTQCYRDGGDEMIAYATPLNPDVPSLAEMSAAALNVLDDDPDGFFLMIEGGAVDKAAHENWSGRMIEEMEDFHQAVETVVSWIETHGGWERTLLVVTADHECGCLLGPGSVVDGDTVRLLPVQNNGAGAMPGMVWLSTDHTNMPVPLYAKGAGCEEFYSKVIATDPSFGRIIDNTGLSRTLHDLWGGWQALPQPAGAPPHPDEFKEGTNPKPQY